MSGTTTLHRSFQAARSTTPAATAAERGIRVPFAAVVGIALLSAAAGALSTAAIDRLEAATAVPRGQPVAASTTLPGATRRDPSVPEASSVFGDRDPAPEDPPPTF